jgi:nitrite reductase/ring-hydroxylating ferredoxin subunit
MHSNHNRLRIEVAGATELAVGETIAFSYLREGELEQGFVLRLDSGFVAYANLCPHWDIELDLGDARFYDSRKQRIYCKNHGATFLPVDGLCDAGPCKGRHLQGFRVVLTDKTLVVEIEDAESPP